WPRGGFTKGIGAVMTAGGSISGLVHHAPLHGACLFAFDPATLSFGAAVTDLAGDYKITGLATGHYQITVGPCNQENLVTITLPHAVRVIAPHATTGVNATLTVGGTVTGIVHGDSPTTLEAGVCVDAIPQSPSGTFGFGISAADGS